MVNDYKDQFSIVIKEELMSADIHVLITDLTNDNKRRFSHSTEYFLEGGSWQHIVQAIEDMNSVRYQHKNKLKFK